MNFGQAEKAAGRCAGGSCGQCFCSLSAACALFLPPLRLCLWILLMLCGHCSEFSLSSCAQGAMSQFLATHLEQILQYGPKTGVTDKHHWLLA